MYYQHVQVHVQCDYASLSKHAAHQMTQCTYLPHVKVRYAF